mgnify:CR=1 FL=1
MKTTKVQLETLSCPSCIKKIESALQQIEAVIKAEVLFNSSKVKVTYNESKINFEEVYSIIEKIGYRVLDKKAA